MDVNFCSHCVRAEFEVGAPETWEKSNVEERNGLSSFCVWLHCRIHPQVAEFKRWNSSGGYFYDLHYRYFNDIMFWLPCSLALQVMEGILRSDIYINLPALRKLDAMLIVRWSFLLLKSQQFCFLSKLVAHSNKHFYLTGDTRWVPRYWILVCRTRKHVIKFNSFGFISQSYCSAERGEMVGASSLCSSRRSLWEVKEALETQTWLC